MVEPRGPLRRPDHRLMDGCIRQCSVRCCADDAMIVSARLRMIVLRESSRLSLRFAISYRYEFDELSAVADGFGFQGDDPEAEETADPVHRDLGVLPVRAVLDTHELV